MFDFALIIHPINEELLHRYEPGMKKRPRHLVKKVLEWMEPFKASEVKGLRSIMGRTAKGVMVMCPLLSEQMVNLNPKIVTKAVIKTAKLAERLKAKSICLTAFTAFTGNRGIDIAREVNIPVTTGSSYTLSMIPETILRAIDYMNIDLSEAKIIVLGATSRVGRICIEILGRYAKRIFVTARNNDSLRLLARSLSDRKIRLDKIDDISREMLDAKVIVVATNSLPVGLDLSHIKSGAVIFDSSYPRKIPNKIRNDILIVDGVAIKPPGDVKLNFDFGLPEGLCFPCMAEPMILALEYRYESFSLGKNITPEKMREIYRLGAKHGFEITTLTSRERIITKETIQKIRENAKVKVRRMPILASLRQIF